MMDSFEIKEINDYISYIPACEKPLSGDVGIIYGKNRTYIYDVGSTIGTLEFLNSIKGEFAIVTSHFHADHIWWLSEHKKGDAGVSRGDRISTDYLRPSYSELYVSAQTKKYTNDGIVVSEPLIIEDETRNGQPLKLEIYPLPSSHAKGCLALIVNDEYVFLGDASYCTWKEAGMGEGEEAAPGKGRAEYNVQQVKAQLDFFQSIPAEKLCLSHDRKFVRPKKVLIRELQALYASREAGKNIIVVR